MSHMRFWQFGSEEHASAAKPILGSATIQFRSDSGNTISVRHIVVDGSSPWVTGRNVTRKCDIILIYGNFIRLPLLNGSSDTLPMSDFQDNSYLPLSCVLQPVTTSPTPTQLTGFTAQIDVSSTATPPRPWSEGKRIVDRVHNNTCGHATYSDTKSLLYRNILWTPTVMKYLTEIINQCTDCIATSVPPPSQGVAISSINRSFNKVVCLDHIHLEDLQLLPETTLQ